jgi:hypothetical protein
MRSEGDDLEESAARALMRHGGTEVTGVEEASVGFACRGARSRGDSRSEIEVDPKRRGLRHDTSSDMHTHIIYTYIYLYIWGETYIYICIYTYMYIKFLKCSVLCSYIVYIERRLVPAELRSDNRGCASFLGGVTDRCLGAVGRG